MSLPKTVIGDDKVLRCEQKLDAEKTLPKMDKSYAEYLLQVAEEQLNSQGDRILFRNADLGMCYTYQKIKKGLTNYVFDSYSRDRSR